MSTLSKSLIVRRAIKRSGKKYIHPVKGGKSSVIGNLISDKEVLDNLVSDKSIVVEKIQTEGLNGLFIAWIKAA